MAYPLGLVKRASPVFPFQRSSSDRRRCVLRFLIWKKAESGSPIRSAVWNVCGVSIAATAGTAHSAIRLTACCPLPSGFRLRPPAYCLLPTAFSRPGGPAEFSPRRTPWESDSPIILGAPEGGERKTHRSRTQRFAPRRPHSEGSGESRHFSRRIRACFSRPAGSA